MKLSAFFGPLSPLHILLLTWFGGASRVGRDGAGNVYYQGRPIKGYKRPRRWVLYNGTPEATKVPPEWHGWLHHQTNDIPQDHTGHRQAWQKPPQANMTGTDNAYMPQGHLQKTGQRPKATGDYTPWRPQN
ncbi:MAG: NADH:ubiquinone oxidoreductase subunit NDUFA12 [Pseudomonadota bacterium]